jgi:hypothetical protein
MSSRRMLPSTGAEVRLASRRQEDEARDNLRTRNDYREAENIQNQRNTLNGIQ